jgi:hypothetical protein
MQHKQYEIQSKFMLEFDLICFVFFNLNVFCVCNLDMHGYNVCRLTEKVEQMLKQKRKNKKK